MSQNYQYLFIAILSVKLFCVTRALDYSKTYTFFIQQDLAWGDHWDEAIGEKMELNPHIPKPDPPKEEEKKEEEEKKDNKEEEKKEEEKEKVSLT